MISISEKEYLDIYYDNTISIVEQVNRRKGTTVLRSEGKVIAKAEFNGTGMDYYKTEK